MFHFIRKHFFYAAVLVICAVSVPLLIITAKNMDQANQFTTFFNQKKSVLKVILYQKDFHIPQWNDLKLKTGQSNQILIFQMDNVPSLTCRRLLQAKYPFPHQFQIENEVVDSAQAHLCGFFSHRNMHFLVHSNFQSFLHLID